MDIKGVVCILRGREPVTKALKLGLAVAMLVFSQSGPAAINEFITVKGTHFIKGGVPYYFIGANFWAGMNLGSPGPSGDRPRLRRELDRLHALGVNNLRVWAATEGPDSEPWRIVPALQS